MKFTGAAKYVSGVIFHNEKNARIEITAQLFPGQKDAYDDVHFSIKGPESNTTSILTRDEAVELHRCLGRVLK